MTGNGVLSVLKRISAKRLKMAKKRRPSPTEKDIQRITETLYNLDTFDKIKDYDSFKTAFDDYMSGSDLQNDKQFKNDVFDTYISRHESVIDTRSLNAQQKQAARKGERIEQITTGKLIKQDIPVQTKNKRVLNIVATRKSYKTKYVKTVYVEKTSVKVKGKMQVRYRDSRGVFASVKKKRID